MEPERRPTRGETFLGERACGASRVNSAGSTFASPFYLLAP